MTTKNEETMDYLESLAGSKLTLGNLLLSIRECEEEAQAVFAAKLGISRQNLCHIEHERRTVSPKMAASFARKLGYSEKQFVRLALQATLEKDGFDFFVDIRENRSDHTSTH